MTLVVINPNSSESVTRGIDASVDPFRAFGLPIRCITLAEGPPGIESQWQSDVLLGPLIELAERQGDATGVVIACFGDPGLFALRERLSIPVIGIQQAGILHALGLGERFGVISILPGSVPRHLRAYGAMGVTSRLAGDRSLGLSVAALADADRTLTAMVETGRTLRDHDGADVLVLGCAGMARYGERISEATGLPVVEPCQAAVGHALTRIAVGT